MSQKNNDIRTNAYVLRRTNYGEADRILNLITPTGKIAVIAKGVRKEKSKLAGGIEMFSLVDVNIHRGRRDLGVLTSAKMLKYYQNLLADLETLELASLILKKVARAAESSDSPEHFQLVHQSFAALDERVNRKLVESWFWLNYAKALGEQVNLYSDASGAKLSADLRYDWDGLEKVLAPTAQGAIGADEIKFLRIMLTANLAIVRKVRGFEGYLPAILPIVRSLSGE